MSEEKVQAEKAIFDLAQLLIDLNLNSLEVQNWAQFIERQTKYNKDLSSFKRGTA